MDKPSHSVKGDGSVKGAIRRLLIDLNQMPEEEVTIDLNEPPKDDLPAPLDLYVDLCFRKEDMTVLRQKYMVVSSSSVADSDGSKDLRFDSGCRTFMCIRDRRVQFQGKYLYALGRSWFKKESTEKNRPQLDCIKSLPKPLSASMVEVRNEGDKEKEKRNEATAEHLAAKELLRQFIKQAKVRARNAGMKGKQVQRQARSTFAPRHATTKNKRFPKLRSVNSLMSVNNE